MDHAAIGLIAAMPEEIKPLLARVGPYRKERIASFNLFRFAIADHQVCLIESGMGPEKAAAAVRVLLAEADPAVIINFGLTGAVAVGPTVGDLVVANRLFSHQDLSLTEEYGLDQDLTELMAATLAKGCRGKPFRVYLGAFITAGQIVAKAKLADTLPQGVVNPVLDMETAAVARVAARSKVPLIAMRAVSDGSDEELGFSLEELTDEELNVRIAKVLLTVVRKPRIVPQLLRLAKNAGLAGKNLAEGLLLVLQALAKKEQ
jgi:adenosylhomocysteine nucleosidase